MFKTRFISMLVLLAAVVTGAWADGERTSHWPDFSPQNYEKNNTLVAGIMIDGVIITADYDGWDQLEVAPFIGDECRCVNGESGNYLYNGYVQEYGDPFPVLDGMLIFYNGEGGEEVTFKMYNHATGVEYTACTVTYQGEPISIITGEGQDHMEGWYDPDNPVFLNFTSPEPAEPTGYTVSMKESTEDAANWQGKAGEGEYQALPLEGVAAGTAVTVKYNGTKKVKSVKVKSAAPAGPKAAKDATAEDLGKVIGADGYIYADADAATAANTTAVAKIVYVGSDNGEDAPYNHGLAIALSDANDGNPCLWKTSSDDAGHTKQTDSNNFASESGLQYNDATHNSDTYPAFKAAIANNGTAAPMGCSAWFLASGYQWKKMAGAVGGYNNLGLRDDAYYWSSSENNATGAWDFYTSNGNWLNDNKGYGDQVRACLAF